MATGTQSLLSSLTRWLICFWLTQGITCRKRVPVCACLYDRWRRWLIGVVSATVDARMLTNAYSQDQELDADHKGVEFLIRAGFDGAGAIRLFTELLERSQKKEDWTDTYFSLHPPLRVRIAAVAKMLE